MRWAVGILAGGKSRRMGQDKARLPYGNGTMLSHMLRRFSGRVLLSAAEATSYSDILKAFPDVTICPDRIPERGPLGGLYSLLGTCPEEALFVCAVDMPLVPRNVPELLAEHMQPEDDALWLVDTTGRVHPLCGLYRKRTREAIRAQLECGCLRMMELQSHIRVRVVPAKELDISDLELLNCNEPERYALACEWERRQREARK